MNYKCEMIIDLPRPRVIELMDSVENLKKWQDGLVNVVQMSGAPGEVGAKMKLEYNTKGKKVELIETITANNFPYSFSATYETKGVMNILTNTFEEIDENRTRWIQENEFDMSGFWGIIGKFMKGVFIKQTTSDMNKFRTFAEDEQKR